ncbi:MAG TPA: HAD hydrolase-like protein, partial [Planctomycetota bacterium]|nr:HAD hydrolase-like protein [Planctomycetota bacterium]
TPRRAHRFSPLPGTEAPRRALFIKRWGTLLAPREPWGAFEPALFAAGAVDALFRASQAGWHVYLIGNEEEVAFGRCSDGDWQAFEAALLAHLAANGVHVARCYAALDHPAGKGSHRRKSVFLLPDTGLFYHALQNDGVALDESWVIGDATPELAAGERAGCRVARVLEPGGESDPELHVDPDVSARSLVEVLDTLTQALVHARQ